MVLVVVVLGHEAGLGVDTLEFSDLLPGVSICSVGYFLRVRPGGFSALQEPSQVLCIGLVYGVLSFLEVVVFGPFLGGPGVDVAIVSSSSALIMGSISLALTVVSRSVVL